MELKLENSTTGTRKTACSNRTFMELKLGALYGACLSIPAF